MNWELRRYTNTVDFEYINDIINSINKNLILASKENNKESFEELLNFISYTLLTKSYNKSIDTFSKVVSTLPIIYPNLQNKYSKTFTEKITNSITSKITISKHINNLDIRFLELSYLGFINLIKVIIEKDNNEDFNNCFQEINSTIFKLSDEKDEESYFYKFLTILLCWIYFLKFNNKISYEKYNLNYLESNFTHKFNTDENFFNFFYNLYNDIENGFWAIKDWEISEPPKNKIYTALMPSQWLSFSFTIILLKFHYILNITDINQIKLNDKFTFELDKIKKYLDQINVENKEYIDFIFPNKINSENLKDQLDFRKSKIIEIFTLLSKKVEIEKYKIIKSIPLSEKKIEEFRQDVGKIFSENSIIINILKELNNISYHKNIPEKDSYGFFHTLLKGKFTFIEGEHYQQIYGLSSYGGELARELDNKFFNKILENVNPTKVKNISSFINNYLQKKKNKKAIRIFSNWNIFEILENIDYSGSTNTYLNIPIITTYLPFKNYIFLIDFSNVELDIYTENSNRWYNNELLVDVTEYIKSDITNDKIQEWNEKDDVEYSEEEIDILESNNVDIKILFKSDFRFLNFDKIKVIDTS